MVQLLGTLVLWRLDARRKTALKTSQGRSGSFSGSRSRGGSGASDAAYVAVPSGDEEELRTARPFDQQRLKEELTSAAGDNPWNQLLDENVIESPDYDTRTPRDPAAGTSQEALISPISPSTHPRRSLSYTLPPPATTELAKERRRRRSSAASSSSSIAHFDGSLTRSRSEKRRGKIFMWTSVLFVLATWALFFGTAVAKIKQKKVT